MSTEYKWCSHPISGKWMYYHTAYALTVMDCIFAGTKNVMKSDYIQRRIFLSWLSVVWLVWKAVALPVLCTKRAWMSKLAVAKMATPVICWATVNTTTCHVMFKTDQSCFVWLSFFIIVTSVSESLDLSPERKKCTFLYTEMTLYFLCGWAKIYW